MRFRKKPVVIEAFKWSARVNWQVPDWYDKAVCEGRLRTIDGHLEIDTIDATAIAEDGDWVIRGTAGELYPCKPDIFAATYENADEPRLGDEGTTTHPVNDD